MPAGKHGSSEITIVLDDSGGTPRTITDYIRSISGARVENILEPSHAFGDAWEEMLATGFARVPPITFGGWYDDTATTGPHIVLRVTSIDRDPQGASRTLTLGFGNSTTFSGECRVASYEVLGRNGSLTEFSAVLHPTGAWAWA
jgi:hypothetical protein